MGLLTMTPEEYQYQVDNLREAFMLIGQEATLFEVDKEFQDMYKDYDLTYKEGREICVIFENNPQPIMKKFKWLTEGEDNPIIAHVVAKDNEGNPLEIRANMKILLKSKYGLVDERMFVVTRVNGSSIDPLTWICKLVPYRYEADVDPDTPGYQETLDHKRLDTDFTFLRTTT